MLDQIIDKLPSKATLLGSGISFFVGFFAGDPGARAVSLGETCTIIPAASENPPVEVCESAENYHFRVVDRSFSRDKFEYRNKIRRLLADYTKRHKLPEDFFHDGTVAMWLSVPESTPEDAHGRVVVATGSAHFLVSLPIDLDVNRIESDMVATLGTKTYPEYFGHRSGTILVKKTPEASEADFIALVERAGGQGVIEQYRDWTTFETSPFAEIQVIYALLADPAYKQLVADTQLNQMFEWLAWREPVFQFSATQQ